MAEVLLNIVSRRLHTLLGPDRDFESGFALGRHILRYWPRHLDTYVELAMASLRAGLTADAADLLRRALSAHPEHGELWAALQSAAMQLGLEEEASRAAQHAADLAPDAQSTGLSPLARATLAASEGAWHDAFPLFHQAYRQTPARMDAALGLAGALMHVGRHEACWTAADVVLAQLPYCLKAHVLAAFSAGRLGNDEAALNHARVARSLDPDNEYGARWFGATAMVSETMPGLPPAALPAWDETERWSFVFPLVAPISPQQIAAG